MQQPISTKPLKSVIAEVRKKKNIVDYVDLHYHESSHYLHVNFDKIRQAWVFEKLKKAGAIQLSSGGWVFYNSFFARNLFGQDRPEIRKMVEAEHRRIRRSRSKGEEWAGHFSGYNLMNHQMAGIEELRKRLNFGEPYFPNHGVLLADDPGLGKTVQAIRIMQDALRKGGRALVVCPATLKIVWQDELKKWGVAATIGIVQGRKDFPVHEDIVIINYDVLHYHTEALHNETWAITILDEAHALKNPKAKRTKVIYGDKRASRKFPRLKTECALALTGTPFLNRPCELFGLLNFLHPRLFPRRRDFEVRYCAGFMSPWGWDASGASNMEELQYLLRSSVMIRRTKEQVLKELPVKRRQIIPLNASSAKLDRLLKKASVKNIQDFNDVGTFLSIASAMPRRHGLMFDEISEARREIGLKILPEAIRHIKEIREETDEPLVLMCHHRDVANGLLEAFEEDAVQLIGGMSAKEKRAAIDKFKSGKADILIGNILVAGTGLTLTNSAWLIFVEPSWVPGELWQAEDRVHRITQNRPVKIQYLVHMGSVVESMLRVVVDKQNKIDRGVNVL